MPNVCPFYEGEMDSCNELLSCADIVISDLHMPRTSGTELFRLQARRGCKLSIINKAIMSSYVTGAYEDEIKDLGCSFFFKPSILSDLPDWLKKREKYFDLSQPLAV